MTRPTIARLRCDRFASDQETMSITRTCERIPQPRSKSVSIIKGVGSVARSIAVFNRIVEIAWQKLDVQQYIADDKFRRTDG